MHKYRVIGSMSGTSCDGHDIALATIWKEDGAWKFSLDQAETLAYQLEWMRKLQQAHALSGRDLIALDREYGHYLGGEIRHFLHRHGVSTSEVHCIGLHGHTVFHQPEKGFTLQIGNGAAAAAFSHIDVVCDFRSHDVALGGQGAPLVPFGETQLFAEYDACVNLGGIANIALHGRDEVAFDICPLNIVLNPLAELLGKPYDPDGSIARSSTIHGGLLQRLNELAYYRLDAPKSLGREYIDRAFWPVLHSVDITAEEGIATCTAHAADQIAAVLNQNRCTEVLFTGGGAFNQFLIESIQAKTKASLVLPDANIIQYKEALIFAFMGLLNTLGEPNVLGDVTGSNQDHIAGCLYRAAQF